MNAKQFKKKFERQIKPEKRIQLICEYVDNYSSDQVSESLEWLALGFELSKNVQNKLLHTNLLKLKASVLTYLGEYAMAIEISHSTAQAYEEMNETKHLAGTFSNVANIHFYMGDFELALEYQQKSLILFTQIDDEIGKARVLGNIGVVFLNLNRNKEALKYFQDSMPLYESNQMRSGIITSIGNSGLAEMQLGHSRKAIANFQRAYLLAAKDKNYDLMSSMCHYFGLAYVRLGQNSRAIEYFNKSIVHARSAQYKRRENLCHEQLHKLYAKQGNYKLACLHFKLSSQMFTDSKGEEQQKKVNRLEILFKSTQTEKEREIEILKNQDLKDAYSAVQTSLEDLREQVRFAKVGHLTAALAENLTDPMNEMLRLDRFPHEELNQQDIEKLIPIFRKNVSCCLKMTEMVAQMENFEPSQLNNKAKGVSDLMLKWMENDDSRAA